MLRWNMIAATALKYDSRDRVGTVPTLLTTNDAMLEATKNEAV